jgi:hypothetical protein
LHRSLFKKLATDVRNIYRNGVARSPLLLSTFAAAKPDRLENIGTKTGRSVQVDFTATSRFPLQREVTCELRPIP